ncbi:hypothetical protein [Primorskyibacter sp. S87]|uniref:hypothetical protein n=1 Tax=Primorskyibacter sp. S87 TaxID=3415126 RepID=UPI003C7D8AAA
MADKKTTGSGAKPPSKREERLKAALKANLGRRKAQARARSASDDEKLGETPDKSEG